MVFVEILEVVFIGASVALAAFIALVWISTFVIDGSDWWKARARCTGPQAQASRSPAPARMISWADDRTEFLPHRAVGGGGSASHALATGLKRSGLSAADHPGRVRAGSEHATLRRTPG